jgi:hypothetical protein
MPDSFTLTLTRRQDDARMIQHELAQPLFSSKRFFRKSEDKST